MRDRFFSLLSALSIRHPWKTVIVTVLAFLLMAAASSTLKMSMTWMDMLPQDEKVTKEFKRILKEFDGAVNVIVLGIEGKDEQSIRQTAAEIETALQPLVNDTDLRRITWKMPQDFIKDHGLMMIEEKDLKNIPDMVRDFNLVPFLSAYNDNLERTFVGGEDKVSENEEGAVQALDGIERFVVSLDSTIRHNGVDTVRITRAIDRLWIGNDAFVSSDGKMLLMMLQPWATLDSVPATVAIANKLDTYLEPVKQAHPDQHIRTGGMHIVTRDEMKYGTEDSVVSTIIAFILIILLLIVALRSKSAPLLAGLVLIVGIVWDTGITALVLGRLNLMTAFCTVYLIGLGIDFSIHFLHGYNEQRQGGISIDDAIRRTFSANGQGILTGALTTAIAFLALLFTNFEMFQELGFVSGVGVVMCMTATFTLLPSIIVLRDRRAERRGSYRIPPQSIRSSSTITAYARIVSRKPLLVPGGVLLLGILSFWYGIKHFSFDSNMMNLEAKGLESIALQDDIVERFNQSNFSNIFTVTSLDSAYVLTQYFEDQAPVATVESPSTVCPPRHVQEKRRVYCERVLRILQRDEPEQPVDIGAFTGEIERLEANIIEMSQSAYMSLLDRVYRRADCLTGLDSTGRKVRPGVFGPLLDYIATLDSSTASRRLTRYQSTARPYSEALTRRMANPQYIDWDMVPEEIAETMVSNDGSQYLIKVYPRTNIWDELLDSPFIRRVRERVPDATGTISFMEVLYRRGMEEGRKAVALSFIAILVLLLIDFRSVTFMVFAIVPLIFSVAFLLGIYGATTLQFNLMNFMAIPLILGIGIDDGVHVCHRYRRRGGTPIPESVGGIGRAIFLTTATTMLAFGSMMFGKFRGNVAIGIVLFLGVGLCFVMTVTLLPAVLSLREKRASNREQKTNTGEER
jgi:hypothetical protein